METLAPKRVRFWDEKSPTSSHRNRDSPDISKSIQGQSPSVLRPEKNPSKSQIKIGKSSDKAAVDPTTEDNENGKVRKKN